MDLVKWGSVRRKEVADTLENVVVKVTRQLENVFRNMSKKDDPGANFRGSGVEKR